MTTDYEACRNLVAMFLDMARARGQAPFLWAKRGEGYTALTWAETADAVRTLAGGLARLGIEPGDRVMLVSENRPEWLIADLAIMAAGAITVPAYVTNTERDHLHILQDSGAKAAIVSTRRLGQALLQAAYQANALAFVVAMEDLEQAQRFDLQIHGWEAVQAMGREGAAVADANAARLERTDTACIIYTSGTGGAPKGVMLHHGAILHNCAGACDALIELGLGDEVFLSFLPLSHSYEHTGGLFFPLSVGAQIYYAEGIDRLSANLLEARPTLMTAVPRLYEVMHARILKGVAAQGGLKARLFHRALALGRKRLAGERLGLGEAVQNALLERLVRDKVRARFGGRLKALVSGGAPLNPEIGAFFLALGVRILQGYGLTESAPVISVNRPKRIKIETVGPPLKGVEVRFAEDGEVLVRGEMVMQGYWQNPRATAEAIRDGWLYTGDIGAADADGYIRITDRKKDLIVNSGGDNISPLRVEGQLTLEPEIAQAMVAGDRRPHLVAVLVPDAEWTAAWAAAQGRPADLAQLAQDLAFRKALAPAVERVNAKLSTIEKVRRFTIAAAPFAIENGQLTATLKVRRHKVREAYGAALDALYD